MVRCSCYSATRYSRSADNRHAKDDCLHRSTVPARAIPSTLRVEVGSPRPRTLLLLLLGAMLRRVEPNMMSLHTLKALWLASFCPSARPSTSATVMRSPARARYCSELTQLRMSRSALSTRAISACGVRQGRPCALIHSAALGPYATWQCLQHSHATAAADPVRSQL